MPLPEMVKPCPEYGGERIAAEASGYVTLTPFCASLLDQAVHRVQLAAVVCVDCGLVRWYTRKPLRVPASQ